MKLKNKLDLDDADINILRNKTLGIKELVISYKTIFINTYSIMDLDISACGADKTNENYLIMRHESF